MSASEEFGEIVERIEERLTDGQTKQREDLHELQYLFDKCYATLGVSLKSSRRRGAQRDAWRELSLLQDRLLACYRLQKTPGGKLLDDIRRAREAVT